MVRGMPNMIYRSYFDPEATSGVDRSSFLDIKRTG